MCAAELPPSGPERGHVDAPSSELVHFVRPSADLLSSRWPVPTGRRAGLRTDRSRPGRRDGVSRSDSWWHGMWRPGVRRVQGMPESAVATGAWTRVALDEIGSVITASSPGARHDRAIPGTTSTDLEELLTSSRSRGFTSPGTASSLAGASASACGMSASPTTSTTRIGWEQRRGVPLPVQHDPDQVTSSSATRTPGLLQRDVLPDVLAGIDPARGDRCGAPAVPRARGVLARDRAPSARVSTSRAAGSRSTAPGRGRGGAPPRHTVLYPAKSLRSPAWELRSTVFEAKAPSRASLGLRRRVIFGATHHPRCADLALDCWVCRNTLMYSTPRP